MKIYTLYELINKKYPFPSEKSNKTISLKDLFVTIFLIIIFIILFVIIKNNKKVGIPLLLLYLYILYKKSFLCIFPYNLLLSCVTNTPPYLDKNKYFPEHKIFEDPKVWKKIREELDNVLEDEKNISFMDKYDKGQSYLTKDNDNKKGWKVFFLKTMNKDFKENQLKCPYTSSLINSIPNINTAFFSILDEKKQIPIHTGYYKGVLRYHLGMIVPEPEKTYILVHNKKYNWKEGDGVVFDDMFPHQVYNHSNKRRVVLFIDIKRPCKFPFSVTNEYMNKLINNSSYIQDNARKIEKQINL